MCHREIASSIKTLLDAVNRVIAEMPPHMAENGTKQVGHDQITTALWLNKYAKTALQLQYNCN